MTHTAIHELQQHAAALRRLARDLVGAADADDALQDAAVEVLRSPPPERGPLLAWLRSVVRHVASKRRRAAVVRARHEAVAMKANERAFAAAGLELVDALRDLTDQVSALPEPYRSTVLARYLQDHTPSEIAAATGVPVRTVKTRLQRGLALLREREATRGRDWRQALVGAFGLSLDPAAPVAGTTAAISTTGVLLMGATTKWVTGAAVLLLLAGAMAWQLLGASGPTIASPPPAAAPAAVVATGELPAAAATAGESDSTTSTVRTAATAAPPPPVPKAKADEIVVRVVDAASGEPVLAYGLRQHMSPQPNLLAKSQPLLHAGEHGHGRLVLPASAFVDRGFVVEDASGTYLPSPWFAAGAAVDRDGERTIEVRLPVPVEVRVKVVLERSGEVVASSRVELLRPWIVPHPITALTMAAPSDRFLAQASDNALTMRFINGRALLLGDATTDAAGVAVLRVPPGESLALRVTGARHGTVIREPWQAPDEPSAEVVVPVAMGAAVRGRITPAKALAALQARVPEVGSHQQGEVEQMYATGVRLVREGTGEARPPGVLGREPVVLAADGSFEIGGLSPGTWRMNLRYALSLQPEASGRLGSIRRFEIELPKLELTDGELRVVDLDVSDWVPGTLRWQVPRDERMNAKGTLQLFQTVSVGPPLAANRAIGLPAAPGDRIDVPLPPARYLAMWLRADVLDRPFLLGEFEVRAREVTAADLAVDASTVLFQVFEADGATPVRGKLRLERGDWHAAVDTDEGGAAAFDAMPRGELTARFWRWNAAQPNGPFPAPLDLGAVRATNDGTPLVLRLPAR